MNFARMEEDCVMHEGSTLMIRNFWSSKEEVEDEGVRCCAKKPQSYACMALSCSRTSYLTTKSKARTHSSYADDTQVPLDATVDCICLALSYQCRR